MILDDTQTQQLKDWITKKLGDVGDADPDILADYALALIKGDGDLKAVRERCIESLRDFLFDGTEAFVDQILEALQTHSYDPNYRPPQSTLKAAPSGPRKRTFDERNENEAPDAAFTGERQIKQARRGGRREGRGGRHGQQQNWDNQQFGQNQAIPQINPQDAFAALVAMQQAMGLPALPGMDQFSGQFGQNGHQNRKRGRCRDYDNKGFCTRGAACPYEHGNDALVVGQNGSPRGRDIARGRGRGGARGGRRADFSSAGPNQDTSITALVVEQIPEDKLEEQALRNFFDQFGTISKIELQASKKLAIVTFSTYDEANAAYMSPKVIFDNRFVKVFWYKPGGNAQQSASGTNDGQDTEMKNAEPEIDHEEVARRQEEAQRKHEESKKQREEAQKQKSDIDAKLKAMEAERQKMAEMLAKRSVNAQPASDATNGPKDSEQTKGLKEQLAKLEAEAKSLGIDPEEGNGNGFQPAYRGRGGYRGRGVFAPRGRGRGGWAAASTRGGAVKRLDNRPRTLAIVLPNGSYNDHDEALRQYLLFSDNLEHATLSQHPNRTDAAMLAFEERYRAEQLMTNMRSPAGIPNVGPVEVSWMPNPVAATPITPTADKDASATAMDTTVETTTTEGDAPYDMAEDDRWN